MTFSIILIIFACLGAVCFLDYLFFQMAWKSSSDAKFIWGLFTIWVIAGILKIIPVVFIQ